MRVRRFLPCLVAFLFVGTTFVPTAVAAARPTVVDWLSGVRDSADLAGEAVARGHVRDGRGRPGSGRAVLVAFPPHEVMATTRVGDALRLRPVGKATIDPHGRFTLRIDPAIRLADLRSPTGTVDFEVLIDGPNGSVSYAFSRKMGARPNARSGRGDRPLELDLTLEPRSAPDQATRLASTTAAPLYCITTLKEVYAPNWVLVAELYTGPHATVDFTYAVGAQSTVGVGVSISGSAGSFSQGGKITVGSSGSVNFAVVPQNQRRVEETQWRYAKWVVSCPMAVHFEARPHTWVGGSAYYNAASTPAAPYCTPYRAGDRPTIDQHQAIEWSNGVRISAIIGIDLSTTTGFTTKAAQQWTFITDGKLCGTNDYPFQARTTVGT